MAIDIIARGLASSLLGEDGKIASEKLPALTPPEGAQFHAVGALTDPAQIEGRTAEEVLLMMLFGIVTPTLTDPSFTATISPLVAIVDEETTFTGKLNFNRGAISPAYGTSGYRAGVAINYQVNDVVSTESNYSITIVPKFGNNQIICTVNYAEGEQPLDSLGNNYLSPYPAGSLSIALNVQGAYQIYSAQGDKLDFEYTAQEDSYSYYLVTFAKETTDGEKQSFALPNSVTVIGIQQFDPISSTWQWIGGSAEASLETFDTTVITGDTLGKNEDYTGYIHNGSKTGERELRICVV